MKILFLAPHPFFAERGTPIAVRLALEALSRQGHMIDLLTYHEGVDIDVPNMRIVRIARPPGVSNVPIGFSAKKLICDIWLAVSAYRLIFSKRYDVVHAVEEAVFIALAVRPFRKFRLVYDMDSLMSDQIAEKWPEAGPLLPVLRWFERLAMRRADLVLPVCEAIAQRAREATSPEKVHLLPDVAFAAPETPTAAEDLRSICTASGPLALYVGNLEGYQGVGLLIDAMEAVPPTKRCNLIVIGGTPDMVEEHRAMAAAKGLERHVHFLGHRSIEHLGDYLRQADILCSPRLKGVNTPMKIYSYMAAGKAILATDIASHSQVLDASCAMLVQPDAKAMAHGFEQLIEDTSLRDTLGAASAKRAGDEYSLAAFEGRIKRAYATISA
ncbi:MAG: glycosyltransferase [Sphingomonadaceae bacterium]